MGNEDRGIAFAHDIVSVFFWVLLQEKLVLILLQLVVEFCGIMTLLAWTQRWGDVSLGFRVEGLGF